MINFLYTTAIGRLMLKSLVSPAFSKAAAGYFSSPLSKWLVYRYIDKYDIDMSEYSDMPYRSFNDFFTRRKEIKAIQDNVSALTPCDAFLSVYTISDTLTMNIKQSKYTIADLLDDKELSRCFEGGLCCVFRLEPQHYHHYLYPVDGTIKFRKRIDGVLHSVRPVCCEAYPVWFRNSREYVLVDSPLFGKVVQMEVGALLVGKIRNDNSSATAAKGSEKGYFEYGGSTIILLFEKDGIQLLPDYDAIIDTKNETPVKAGRILGQRIKRGTLHYEQ